MSKNAARLEIRLPEDLERKVKIRVAKEGWPSVGDAVRAILRAWVKSPRGEPIVLERDEESDES